MNVVVIALASMMLLMGGVFPNLLSSAAKEMIQKNYGKMENLAVYIESVPSFNVFFGKVDRIRIMAQGFAIGDFKIAGMEIVTSPVTFNSGESLSTGKFRLQQPIIAEGKITLTEQDLNNYLNSPRILKDLSKIEANLALFPGEAQVSYLSITKPHIYLHPQEIVFTFDLASGEGMPPLPIIFKGKLTLLDNHKLGLASVEISTDDFALPQELAVEVEKALNPVLDLNRYSTQDVSFNFYGLELYEKRFVVIAGSKIYRIN